MFKYTIININFSTKQKKHLSDAHNKQLKIDFRVPHENLFNGKPYYIGTTQYNSIKKRYDKGLGSAVKFSIRLLNYNRKHSNIELFSATGLDPIKFGTTTNEELDAIVEFLNIKHYVGCIPNKPELLPAWKENQCGIINLDGVRNGTHWVAYFCSKNLPFNYYFDSYGVHPPQTLVDYLKTNSKKKILSSQLQFQTYESNLCGFYVVLFLLYMDRTLDYSKFITLFNANNIEKNDNIVKNLSDKYFGNLLE